MRQLTGLMVVVVLVFFVTAPVWSSEADDLRAKAKAVQREAETLAKEGRKEEAEKLGRVVKELLQTAEKQDGKSSTPAHSEVGHLQQRLKTLEEKGRALKESKNEKGLAELQKHRADVERELAEHRERMAGTKQTGKRLPKAEEETGLRIKHIRVAVENLNAAGLHDAAEELAKKADSMERERPQAADKVAKESSTPEKRKHFDPDRKRPELDRKRPELNRKFAPGHPPVEELRGELQRLRAELNELREEVKKRP